MPLQVTEYDEIDLLSNEIDPNLTRYLEEMKRNLKSEMEDYIRSEIEKAVMNATDLDNESSLSQRKLRNYPRMSIAQSVGATNRRPLTGLQSTSTQPEELDQDLFSMMMLTNPRSLTWVVGFLSFSIQIILGVLIILDQIDTDNFSTSLSIPIKGTIPLRFAQFLAIVLSIMTQTDLLMGVRTILIFPYVQPHKWRNTIGVQRNDRATWIVQIFVPNFLKILQGGLILVASFVVVIQSQTTVDVLKDYSALFVVSSIDDLFYNIADMGVFGYELYQKAFEVKEIEIIERTEKIMGILKSTILFILVAATAVWIHVIYGQSAGRYVKQKFPLCDTDHPFNSTEGKTKYLHIIGDNKCQFGFGEGTNTGECGWDGGDCIVLNRRYPECLAKDFDRLGNKECDADLNSKGCGFDNGDCKDFNDLQQERYNKCIVENIGWINNGFCDGGEYFSEDCEYDGGDCATCKVDNINLIGNGVCDKGAYNTEECSYDGGDCLAINEMLKKKYPKCNVANIGWIGDGTCNGQEYASPDCGNDGGDCNRCIVKDMMLIGDGVCNGGDYLSKECSHDGHDCLGCDVDDPTLIGDGKCDGGKYNVKECSYDGGDCEKNNTQLQQIYRNCSVQNPWFIGDGECHGGDYHTEACGFDGGDCQNCTVNMTLFSNGFCDGKNYNTIQCGFDGGDCIEVNNKKKSLFSFCQVDNIGWIDDGICDGGKYATGNGCVQDGGDCENCIVDDMQKIGDEICDRGDYNVEECSFDGFDCIPSIKFVGDEYNFAKRKWGAGVLGFDGSIYAVPDGARKILKINTTSDESFTVGKNLGDDDSKWAGSFVWTNGTIYGVPWDAKSILSYDPSTDETNLIESNHPLLNSEAKFSDGVVAPNKSAVYFLPAKARKVVKFDPSNKENPLSEIGDDLETSTFKTNFGVLALDGNIYGIPAQSMRVLKINVNNDTTSFIGDLYEGEWKWAGGTLGPDGNIYACPDNFHKVLQINIKDQTTALVGPDLGDEKGKWHGFVQGTDGFLYGMPWNSNKLLRFDPFLHTATLIPLDKVFHENEQVKWFDGVLAENNGHIYTIPTGSSQIMAISPLVMRP